MYVYIHIYYNIYMFALVMLTLGMKTICHFNEMVISSYNFFHEIDSFL